MLFQNGDFGWDNNSPTDEAPARTIGARSGFTKSVKKLAPRSTLVYFHETLPSSGRRISPFTPTITIKDCYENGKHTDKVYV